jgi:hypothetical protein
MRKRYRLVGTNGCLIRGHHNGAMQRNNDRDEGMGGWAAIN